MERPQGKEKGLNQRLRGGGTLEVARKCGARALKERGCGLRWDLRSEGSPYKSWEVEEIRVGTRDGRSGDLGEKGIWECRREGDVTGLEEGAEMQGVPETELGGRLRPWVLPPGPPASKTYKTGC